MDAIHELYHALTTSDYVLVGAGAGLSAAAGISFADERAFKRDYPALWAQGVHSAGAISAAISRPCSSTRRRCRFMTI